MEILTRVVKAILDSRTPDRKGAAPAMERCCFLAEPERERDRSVGFDEQRSERTASSTRAAHALWTCTWLAAQTARLGHAGEGLLAVGEALWQWKVGDGARRRRRVRGHEAGAVRCARMPC
jgi:hypothetical protein